MELIQHYNCGAQNEFFPSKYSHKYSTHQFKSNTRHLLPTASIYLETIIIPTHVSLTSILNLVIESGGLEVWNIPFKLILKYSTIKIIDDEYNIILNHNKLFGESNDILVSKNKFVLLRTVYNLVYLRLNSEYVFNYELMLGIIDYPKDVISRLDNGLDSNINQYQTVPLDSHMVRLNVNHPSLGIYIETNQPLLKYQLLLNDIITYDYDSRIIKRYLLYKRKIWSNRHSATLSLIFKDTLPLDVIKIIETYCQVDFEYLYYFTFGIGEDSNSTINFSCVDSIHIQTLTPTNQYNGNIYVKNKNIFRFMCDMSTVVYGN